MIRKVLIVDDDQIWLRLIKKKFEGYSDAFDTETAVDGLEAVEKLKEHAVSLVVTDLQMPNMDGLTLLAHLSEQYPDIPVIIMTAYSSPNSKKSVLDGGAAGYIEKPFVVEDLAKKIISTLEKETEGGTLQTVPLDMFIQLIEMEQKTCTIRVLNKATGEKGVLFFNDGNLMEARHHNLQGTPAAYKIFAWDKVTLAIQDECAIKEKRIDGDLQAILFDAIRIKDEAGHGKIQDGMGKNALSSGKALPADAAEESASASSAPRHHIRDKIEAHLGRQVRGVVDIAESGQWSDSLAQMASLGLSFGAGSLRSMFVGQNDPNDYIIVPGAQNIIITVTAQCPRDRLLDILSE